MWGHVDHGPLLLAPPSALDRVHLAAGPDLKFDFSLFVFLDFVANLQKSYLELGRPNEVIQILLDSS